MFAITEVDDEVMAFPAQVLILCHRRKRKSRLRSSGEPMGRCKRLSRVGSNGGVSKDTVFVPRGGFDARTAPDQHHPVVPRAILRDVPAGAEGIVGEDYGM